MGAVFSPTLAGLGGTISETQHGSQTGPAAAHEMADVTGAITTAQHGDHTGAGSGGRDAHHGRTEAKNTPGSASEETVTWTVAFAAVPVAVVSPFQPASVDVIAFFQSISTTAAIVRSYTTGAPTNNVKGVIAQAAT